MSFVNERVFAPQLFNTFTKFILSIYIFKKFNYEHALLLNQYLYFEIQGRFYQSLFPSSNHIVQRT